MKSFRKFTLVPALVAALALTACADDTTGDETGNRGAQETGSEAADHNTPDANGVAPAPSGGSDRPSVDEVQSALLEGMEKTGVGTQMDPEVRDAYTRCSAEKIQASDFTDEELRQVLEHYRNGGADINGLTPSVQQRLVQIGYEADQQCQAQVETQFNT